jgi:hypothetical protein
MPESSAVCRLILLGLGAKGLVVFRNNAVAMEVRSFRFTLISRAESQTVPTHNERASMRGYMQSEGAQAFVVRCVTEVWMGEGRLRCMIPLIP